MVTALIVWGAIPFVTISVYAGLAQVSRELVEAAEIDGAGPFRVFRDVTFPVLKPILLIVTSLSIIWDFGVFAQPYLLVGASQVERLELPDGRLRLRRGLLALRLRPRRRDLAADAADGRGDERRVRSADGQDGETCVSSDRGRYSGADVAFDGRTPLDRTSRATPPAPPSCMERLSASLVSVVIVFPVFWMISTAFKPDDEIYRFTPTWFSTHPTLDHFRDAIDPSQHPYFWDGVKNSLIVVSATVAISMVLAFLAAVALAKYGFSGRQAVHRADDRDPHAPAGRAHDSALCGARALPSDERVAGFVVLTVILLPFAIWTLRGFILGIPKDLEEAAMVDGSSRVGAFVRILLPLVAPGLVATSVFVFITAWNEFIFASVILQDQSKQTLTVWLSYVLRDEPCDGLGCVSWPRPR